MLNFIICDDNKTFANNEKKIIDNFMMKYDIEYKCFVFNEYNDDFKNIMKEELGFKVYLLDIQTPKGSGLDIARNIREEQDDWSSVISIITAYNEYKYDALANRLYLLDFINKLNNCDQKLKEILEIVMKQYDNRHKSLNYEYNHVMRKVEFRHIIYIEKEMDSKRCIIKTTYGETIINKTLNDTYHLLDKRFFKTSRSMIVNVDYIDEYNIIKNKIVFKNGDYTYEISRDKKKELRKYAGTNS